MSTKIDEPIGSFQIGNSGKIRTLRRFSGCINGRGNVSMNLWGNHPGDIFTLELSTFQARRLADELRWQADRTEKVFGACSK